MELKPLSFTKYFCNNTKKTLTMLFALVLSVFMILVFQMVTFAVNEPARLGDVAKVDNMSQVHPGSQRSIDPKVLAEIRSNPLVETLIPMELEEYSYNHFFGTCNMSIFFISDKDIPYVLEKKGLTLKEGSLPRAGEMEVVLDWMTANNRNKKVGDYIGKSVDPKDSLPGKYKISGILEGQCLLGLIPVDASEAENFGSFMVFPKEGKVDAVNDEFSRIPTEKAHFWTKTKAIDNYKNNAKSLNTIFGVLSMAIIVVMAFASGNASYAQYFTRRYEFGVLLSIGYTRSQIMLRAVKEILMVNLIGYAGGVVLTILVGSILNLVFFIPNGYPFSFFQPDGWLKAITIPLCTAVFGLIPAGWLLSKIDPMTVVEKFE